MEVDDIDIADCAATVTTTTTTTTSEQKGSDVQCPVCVQTINKTTRAPVACPMCGYTTCRTCYQHFCLDRQEKQCMQCHIVHTQEFFRQNVARNFRLVPWRSCVEAKLFDAERAQFATTMKTANKWKQLQDTHDRSSRRIADLTEEIATERCRMGEASRDIARLLNSDTVDDIDHECAATDAHPPCSKADCRGFVIDGSICGLCRQLYCRMCREQLAPQHVCNPDTLHTLLFVRSDTRPCPKCSVRIHRIDGCDQMFCTQCKTAFSYRTGDISTGRIHNPHYFEYMRTHDNQGGGIRTCDNGRPQIDPWKISVLLQILPAELALHIQKILTNIDTLHDIILFNMHQKLDRFNHQIRLVRIKYMLNLVEKPEYVSLLAKRHKYQEHLAEVAAIYETIINVVDDIFVPIIDSMNETQRANVNHLYEMERVKAALRDLQQLREHTNRALADHERACECSRFYFNFDFERQRAH